MRTESDIARLLATGDVPTVACSETRSSSLAAIGTATGTLLGRAVVVEALIENGAGYVPPADGQRDQDGYMGTLCGFSIERLDNYRTASGDFPIDELWLVSDDTPVLRLVFDELAYLRSS